MKNVLYGLCLLVATLGLVSCSKDEDGEPTTTSNGLPPCVGGEQLVSYLKATLDGDSVKILVYETCGENRILVASGVTGFGGSSIDYLGYEGTTIGKFTGTSGVARPGFNFQINVDTTVSGGAPSNSAWANAFNQSSYHIQDFSVDYHKSVKISINMADGKSYTSDLSEDDQPGTSFVTVSDYESTAGSGFETAASRQLKVTFRTEVEDFDGNRSDFRGEAYLYLIQPSSPNTIFLPF